MSEHPHRCLCWSGLVCWSVRAEDRRCCLCGRRRIDVVARAPVLAAEPSPTLAAYLLPGAPGHWRGRLEFDLEAPIPGTPRVRWQAVDGSPPSWVEEQKQPTPDRLVLHLAAEDEETLPGVLGQGRLEIDLAGETFVFDVLLHAVEASPRQAWLHHTLDAPPAGSHFVVYREAERGGCLYLHYRLDEETPLQWHGARCDHPAAEVRLLDPDQARPTLRAEVVWDTTLLRRDVPEERVAFHLQARGLDEVVVELGLVWRLRHPLAFQPAGLVVPVLTRGQNELAVVGLTNTDLQPIEVESVASTAPWVEPVQAPAALLLPPGASASLLLELRPDQVEDGPGPHSARLDFFLAGRGKQTYAVDVWKVRAPQPLAHPLLIDPGPPRIALGLVDPLDNRLVSLGSLEPEQLGLDEEDYLAAVHGDLPAQEALEHLVAGARNHARSLGLAAGPVLLCRQPWLASVQAPGDVELVDWAGLCRERVLARAGLPASTVCARVDGWSAHLVEPSAGPGSQVRVRPIRGVRVTLGAGILRCLVQQLGRLPPPDDQPFGWLWEQNTPPPRSARWLMRACEALLADYRWGPDYAWRRLLAAIWRRLPSARRLAFDVAQADLALQEELRDYVRRLGQVVRSPQVAAGRPVRACALVSVLFAREAVRAGIQSLEAELGMELVILPARWLEWLARSWHSTLPAGG